MQIHQVVLLVEEQSPGLLEGRHTVCVCVGSVGVCGGVRSGGYSQESWCFKNLESAWFVGKHIL